GEGSMSRFARSDSRYADTLAWIASRTAGSMSSTRSGTAKKKLTDTYAPLPAAKAEVDGDRDSLACAAIRAHPVRSQLGNTTHMPARGASRCASPRAKPSGPGNVRYGAYMTGATPRGSWISN